MRDCTFRTFIHGALRAPFELGGNGRKLHTGLLLEIVELEQLGTDSSAARVPLALDGVDGDFHLVCKLRLLR